MVKRLVLACCLTMGAACAQEQWEIGVIGGLGYSPDLTVSNGTGRAKTGIQNDVAFGVFGGNEMYNYWSGEVRYLYRYSDLKLSSGSTGVGFDAHSHIVNFDVLGHLTPRKARIRPYVAFGGGVRVMQGTGIESASQPLGNFAALTATSQVLPLGDVGIGVKLNLQKHLRLRIETRDYISPSPTKLIFPAPGAHVTGIMNDIQGLVGLSFVW